MAIPDAFLSPQFFLLRFLDIGQFVFFQIILFYALGFIGLLWLRHKLQWSIFPFTMVFILFNFNGHILAHISMGHLTWMGYFLFPWFVILVLNLFEGKTNWKWVTGMASLLFITLLQGSYHQYVWMLIFLGFLAIFKPEHIFILLKSTVFSILLGMVRFLPLFSIITTLNKTSFLAGYPDIQSVLFNMIMIRQPGFMESIINLTVPVGLWETSIYLGILGTAFLIYFGLIYPINHIRSENRYGILLFPTLGLFLLSFDQVYRFVFVSIPLPVFTGERVVTRFVSLVIVFVLVLAAIEFQNWLDVHKTSKFSIFAMIALAILGINDLLQNFREWIIQVTSQKYPNDIVSNQQWLVANNYNDQIYIYLIEVGCVITVVSFIFLFLMVMKEIKNEKNHSLSLKPSAEKP